MSNREYVRKVSKGLPEYYYMDIYLDFGDHSSPPGISASVFKLTLIEALRILFGEVGAAISVDILQYNQEKRQAILRVPQNGYVKLRTSLILYGRYKGIDCAFRVNKVSAFLAALSANSRTYNHNELSAEI